MSSSKVANRNTSSKAKTQATDAIKLHTSSNEETQASGSLPSDTEARVPNDMDITTEHASPSEHAVRTSNSTARRAHFHEPEQKPADPSVRRKSADSDLTTWTHLSVDRSGAKIRTICMREHEDGGACSHTVRERRYRDIPRVDGPSEKITVDGVEAMMERDARVEREGDGEGEEEWVVIG